MNHRLREALKRTPARDIVLAWRRLNSAGHPVRSLWWDITWRTKLGLAPIAPAVLRIRAKLPHKCKPVVVHVIGDSHCAVFSGNDEMTLPWPERANDRIVLFRTYRLGAGLAYNLGQTGTSSRTWERLLALLAFGPIEPQALLLLSFGEIDCRAHLLVQAERQNRNIEDVVNECIVRYLSAIMMIRGLGYRPLVWNVIPSGEIRYEHDKAEFPHFGTLDQRNAVTALFNRQLEAQLTAHGIPFVSVYEDLIDANGLPKHEEFYLGDSVHLNQRILPVAIVRVVAALRSMGVDVSEPILVNESA